VKVIAESRRPHALNLLFTFLLFNKHRPTFRFLLVMVLICYPSVVNGVFSHSFISSLSKSPSVTLFLVLFSGIISTEIFILFCNVLEHRFIGRC